MLTYAVLPRDRARDLWRRNSNLTAGAAQQLPKNVTRQLCIYLKREFCDEGLVQVLQILTGRRDMHSIDDVGSNF